MRAFAFACIAMSAACLTAGSAARAQTGFDAASYAEAADLVRHAAGGASIGRARLLQTAGEDFNVRYMGLLTLGAHRRNLDAKTLGAFDEHFAAYLAARLEALLELPGAGALKVTGVTPAGARDVVVSALIEGRASSRQADFRIRAFAGRAQIIDVSVGGVSLIERLRADTAQWLKDGGSQGLIEAMRAAAGEAP